MIGPAGQAGQLREDELPAIRVMVPAAADRRRFRDDLALDDVGFDSRRTAMLVWHDRYPIGRGYPIGGWARS
jgi:hypothetical protein